MTAANILTHLRARGLTLTADGGMLHVSPRSLLTDSDRQAIRQHKPDLLTLLAPTCRLCGQPMRRSIVVVVGERGWFCESPAHPTYTTVEWTRETEALEVSQ